MHNSPSPVSPDIVVLMSTYNGEKYVREQIASILQQLPANGELLIRDDGSTDNTTKILEQIEDDRIRVHKGTNIGFSKSFFWLLDQAPMNARLTMLADQDDVWLPSKIQRAIDKIGGSNEQASLYCSRQTLVNEQLNFLSMSLLWKKQPSFNNALVENIATGCTIAMNAKAVALVRKTGDLDKIYFHDWWIYLVVSAFGTVYFDPNASILYRQHGKNVVGRGTGWKRYIHNLRFMKQTSWIKILYDQVQNFYDIWKNELPDAKLKYLENYFAPPTYSKALKLAMARQTHRQNIQDDIFLRILLIAEFLLHRGLTSKKIS